MGFEVGKSGNPQGRPKGAKGQTPATVKAAIAEALESRSNEIAAKLDAVTDPAKWLELYAKFAVFIIPKNSKVEESNPYESMTKEELEARMNELHAKMGVKMVPIDA
jgi:hypothetical protein